MNDPDWPKSSEGKVSSAVCPTVPSRRCLPGLACEVDAREYHCVLGRVCPVVGRVVFSHKFIVLVFIAMSRTYLLESTAYVDASCFSRPESPTSVRFSAPSVGLG